MLFLTELDNNVHSTIQWHMFSYLFNTGKFKIFMWLNLSLDLCDFCYQQTNPNSRYAKVHNDISFPHSTLFYFVTLHWLKLPKQYSIRRPWANFLTLFNISKSNLTA